MAVKECNMVAYFNYSTDKEEFLFRKISLERLRLNFTVIQSIFTK